MKDALADIVQGEWQYNLRVMVCIHHLGVKKEIILKGALRNIISIICEEKH